MVGFGGFLVVVALIAGGLGGLGMYEYANQTAESGREMIDLAIRFYKGWDAVSELDFEDICMVYRTELLIAAAVILLLGIILVSVGKKMNAARSCAGAAQMPLEQTDYMQSEYVRPTHRDGNGELNTQARTSNPRFCVNCGEKLEEGALFCIYCRTRI